MNIEFLATVAVIAPDPPASRKLYVETLGRPLTCFGTAHWPVERPVPQASIEFGVRDAAAVSPAARELEPAGYELLHPARTEPWGQTVAVCSRPRVRSSESRTHL